MQRGAEGNVSPRYMAKRRLLFKVSKLKSCLTLATGDNAGKDRTARLNILNDCDPDLSITAIFKLCYLKFTAPLRQHQAQIT